ncbi:MAG: alpha/beta fold hydrolase [Deltaproteobacteria bacterium]|nr:alpha/beta fold hydrolase [Deltaproteobacteria bacterium]
MITATWIVSLLLALVVMVPSEATSAVRAEAVEIPGPKNLTLTADYRAPINPRPKAPAILLVHGIFQTGRFLVVRPLAEALAEKGYPTLSITLSHGVSLRTDPLTCDSLHRYPFEDSLPEIRAWLQWLRQRGHPTAILVGHSIGANQVLYYAVRTEDPALRGLVTVALVASERPQLIELFQQTTGKSYDAMLQEAKRLVKEGKGDHLLTVPFFACSQARVTARAFLSYFGPDAPRRPEPLLPAVRIPYLAVHGSADSRAAALAPQVRSLQKENPAFRWKEIEAADHFFREFLAEDLAEAAQQFLKGLP